MLTLTLLDVLALISQVLSASLPVNHAADPDWRRAHATTFAASSVDAGNPNDELACAIGQHLQEDTIAVAAQTWLPCNTLLEIYSPVTHKTVRARVLDRGPRRARRPEKAEDLDLSSALAVRLGWKRSDRGPIYWRICE